MEWFEKNKLKLKKAYSEEYSGESDDCYLIQIKDPNVNTESEKDGIWISTSDEESGVSANFDVVHEEVIISLIEYAVKKLNKFKTMLETLT